MRHPLGGVHSCMLPEVADEAFEVADEVSEVADEAPNGA
jgi:hypothetical protein